MMTIRDKIVPGMVGVDIGCGMETVELAEREVDLEKLDLLIRREIPYGHEVRDDLHALNAEIDLSQLRCAGQVNLNCAMRSIGSLGGGTGYQIQSTIARLKAEGRFREIQKTITALEKEHVLNIPKDLTYVEGRLFEDCLHDMKLTQRFAMLNCKAMIDVIMSGMGFTAAEAFTTISTLMLWFCGRALFPHGMERNC